MNTTAKHTPGPWYTKQLHLNYTEWVVLHSIVGGTRRVDKNGAFSESDARLIAAAPDLLAACEAVEEAWAGNGDMATAVDAALLAITKAQGES